MCKNIVSCFSLTHDVYVLLLIVSQTVFIYTARRSRRCRDVSVKWSSVRPNTSYTRCYFNVRLKADTSQLNLPHRNDNKEV